MVTTYKLLFAVLGQSKLNDPTINFFICTQLDRSQPKIPTKEITISRKSTEIDWDYLTQLRKQYSNIWVLNNRRHCRIQKTPIPIPNKIMRWVCIAREQPISENIADVLNLLQPISFSTSNFSATTIDYKEAIYNSISRKMKFRWSIPNFQL